jgi:outer membrane protein OmpA-like peptidoglycan-associated protein
MKKLVIMLALVLTGLVSFSQIPKPQSASDFSTWSVTPSVSFSYENTDVENNDPFYTKTPLNIGYGLEVSKQLSHFTSLQVNGFRTSLEASEKQFGFTSDISQLDVRFRFNMTNGSIFRSWQNTQLYAFLGYGVLWYDSKQTFNLLNPGEYSVKNNTRVIPVGVGVKYRLGNRTSLSVDLAYNHTNTDNLDTWSNGLTSKDAYTRANFGFTYNLSKKKILEWDQPWMYLVPDVVHDTTVVIQKIEYTPPKTQPIKHDTAIIYYFAGHYQIEETYLKTLDHVLERARNENYNIEIMAYCDSSGNSKGNYDLVTKRADKVFQYATKFISEDRITIFRYDESWATYAPEARNRKVIVRLVK